MDKICGVYLIVNPNGRRYIGSSKDVRFRWTMYKRMECKSQVLLYNSFKKYGTKSHEFKLLFSCLPEERLSWERLFGDIYLSLKDFGGLNHSLPQMADKPLILSQEIRKQMSESAQKASIRPEVVKKRSDAQKKKHQDAEYKIFHRERTLKSITPELRKAASEKSKKQFSSQEAKDKMREIKIQYFVDNPQAKVKFNEMMKGIFKNTDLRKKISEAAKRTFGNPATNPKSKKVIDINTGQVFDCAKHAAKSIGMWPSCLSERMSGKMSNNTPFRYAINY